MGSLISESGQEVAQKVAREFGGESSVDTFDPLMGALFAIMSNCMTVVSNAGGNPLYMLTDGPEDPVDRSIYPQVPEGATWPKCHLCYVNLAHEVTCKDGRCMLDQKAGYDWMIDRAVADQAERWKRLNDG